MYFFLKHCKASPCLRGRTRQCLACRSLINGINECRGYSWEFHPSFPLGNHGDCRVLSKCNKCKFGPQIFIAGYIAHDKKDSLVSDPRLILQRQYLQEKVIYWTKSFPFFPLSFLAQNFHQSPEIICLCLWERTVKVDTFVILNEHGDRRISYSFRNSCAFLVQWLKLLHSEEHHYFLSCHSLICAAMKRDMLLFLCPNCY